MHNWPFCAIVANPDDAEIVAFGDAQQVLEPSVMVRAPTQLMVRCE